MRSQIIEKGVVIPAGAPDRIPAAMPTVRQMGLRMMYYGWPGMVRTVDGDLLLAACQQILHVSPFGREVIVRSSDGGRTWSEPIVLFDSITDDRDIALNRLQDGTIVATWFSNEIWSRPQPFPWMRPEWEGLRQTIKPDTHKALSRGWLRRSTDGGRTWEQLVHPTLVGQHAGPTVLHNGDLLYIGRYPLEDGSKMVATLSSDGGRTWRIISDLPVPRYFDDVTQKHWSVLGENHALEVAPGRIIAAFRGQTPELRPHVQMARSDDGGCTWTPSFDTGLEGLPPYLLRLQSGVILCITARRGESGESRQIVALPSYDAGQTWDLRHTMVLDDIHGPSGIDIGYPIALETQPNELFCVYYSSPTPASPGYAEADPMKHGILYTRVRLS